MSPTAADLAVRAPAPAFVVLDADWRVIAVFARGTSVWIRHPSIREAMLAAMPDHLVIVPFGDLRLNGRGVRHGRPRQCDLL